MNKNMAGALHIPSGQHVDVVGVKDGAWTVLRSWIKGAESFEVSARDLTEIWPNPDAVDAVDSLKEAGFSAEWIYNSLVLWTGTPLWAQLLMRVWAGSY